MRDEYFDICKGKDDTDEVNCNLAKRVNLITTPVNHAVTNHNRILTTKDVMELLTIGRVAVYNLIASGKLKAAKIAGKYLTTELAVHEFLEKEIQLTGTEINSDLWYNKVTVLKVQDRFQARKGAANVSAERNRK